MAWMATGCGAFGAREEAGGGGGGGRRREAEAAAAARRPTEGRVAGAAPQSHAERHDTHASAWWVCCWLLLFCRCWVVVMFDVCGCVWQSTSLRTTNRR